MFICSTPPKTLQTKQENEIKFVQRHVKCHISVYLNILLVGDSLTTQGVKKQKKSNEGADVEQADQNICLFLGFTVP